MPIKFTPLTQDVKIDELSSLLTFSKHKTPVVSDDPLYCYPKFNKVPSSINFQSIVAPNWLTQKLSKQTELGLFDGKEALGLKLFAIKSRKSTPELSSLMIPQVKEPVTIENLSSISSII